MENGPTYSGDSGLPRSLTDSDFQALSLEVAQARAEAQKLWTQENSESQDPIEQQFLRDAAPDKPSELPSTQASDAQIAQDQISQGRTNEIQASDVSQIGSGVTPDITPGITPNGRSPGPEDFAPMLCNLPIAELMEHALLRAEGVLSDRGALCVRTLPYSGTTPGSYYCVDPQLSQAQALEASQVQRQQPLNPGTGLVPMDETTFWSLYQRAVEYSEEKALYQCDGQLDSHHIGLLPSQRGSTTTIHIICELASQAIMARHWLGPINPEDNSEPSQPSQPRQLQDQLPSITHPSVPETQATNPGSIESTVNPTVNSTAIDSTAIDSTAIDSTAIDSITSEWAKPSSERSLTVIALPGLRGEPWLEPLLETEVFVAIHPGQRLALIGGSRYGGDLLGAITTLLHELHRAKSSQALLISDAVQCWVGATQTTSQTTSQTTLFLGAAGSGKQTLAAALSEIWQRGPILIGQGPQSPKLFPVAVPPSIAAQRKVATQPPITAQVTTASSPCSQFEIHPLLAGGYGNITGLASDSSLFQQLSFGAVLENVPLQESSSRPRFSDLGSAIPFRAAWQATNTITKRAKEIWSDQSERTNLKPIQTIFLTIADTSGVLPAIARLTPAQAIYYLALGYGADLPGWNRHQLTPTAHFAAVDQPRAVADALRWQACLQQQQSPAIAPPAIYVINTGWLGPEGSQGRSLQQRIPVSISKALIQAALAGEIPLANEGSCQISAPPQSQQHSQAPSPSPSPSQSSTPTCIDPVFGWTVPSGSQQRAGHWCHPWNCWDNAQDWQVAAIALAEEFQSQMAGLIEAGLPAEIALAGPCLPPA